MKSESYFNGIYKWNHERWQSEANIIVYTPETGEKRDLWPKQNQMRITGGAKPLKVTSNLFRFLN